MFNNNKLNLKFSDFEDLVCARYIPQKPISLDVLKDIQAEAALLNAGLKSKTQVISEMGGDPRVVLEEIEKERANNKEVVQDGTQEQQEGTTSTPPGD